MDSNIQDSLARLNSILAGRTLKDLLSNVDPSVLTQNSALNATVTSGQNVYLNIIGSYIFRQVQEMNKMQELTGITPY
jgi:hypothetical protein